MRVLPGSQVNSEKALKNNKNSIFPDRVANPKPSSRKTSLLFAESRNTLILHSPKLIAKS
jgi:hypothetical protein